MGRYRERARERKRESERAKKRERKRVKERAKETERGRMSAYVNNTSMHSYGNREIKTRDRRRMRDK